MNFTPTDKIDKIIKRTNATVQRVKMNFTPTDKAGGSREEGMSVIFLPSVPLFDKLDGIE